MTFQPALLTKYNHINKNERTLAFNGLTKQDYHHYRVLMHGFSRLNQASIIENPRY